MERPPIGNGPVGQSTERRVASLLGVAGSHRTGVSVARLTDLLPSDGPPSASDLASWLRDHPGVGTVVGETAFHPAARASIDDLDERRARGERYWARAVELARTPLAPVRPLLRALVVTGSTAYGEPESGDDLDFLAVTRRDAIWVFLAFAYLRERLRPRAVDRSDEPGPCYNYVIDESIAAERFASSRGLLFAREALTSRPVLGESYYRGLVRSAGWMRDELPRLYARWDVGPANAGEAPRTTPWAVRALNRVLYPAVAAYLHLQGLLRNHRFRVTGRGERSFRTITRYRLLMFATERFERLRAAHEADPTPRGASA